ncbi:pectinesterase [Mucilaginibacter yixingensis]|uniref:Pectinesterase n=1 Tax=Mucilaginibacter yixingensis TaxID=1295612 RepID=A0A2T5J7S1_9SPHI|nr:pectinesterase family protein [Mucilaginibacter yixingensis]PTQ95513.1 pectinesterase [Mucilaginibacter yixingensis]
MKHFIALLAACTIAVGSFAQSKKVTVAADGSGDVKTVQAALDLVPMNNKAPFNIYIKNGTYHEKLRLDSGKNFVHMVGQSKEGVILTYEDHPGMTNAQGRPVNTQNSESFLIAGDDFTAEKITFRNDAGFSAGQAVAVQSRGDRMVFSDCQFIGNQDILFLNSERSRQYFTHCYIEGTTDFIFGAATAWFEQCHIESKKNSHVTAASTPQSHPFGYVFNECKLTAKDTSLHRVSLGRPWRPYACVAYLHCEIGAHIMPEGFANWNNTESYKTARYSEYKDYGPGANPEGRVKWAHQLTDEEAKTYTVKNVLAGKDNWNPLKQIK